MFFKQISLIALFISNEERIEKGDYWWYRTPITVTEAIDELEGKVEDVIEMYDEKILVLKKEIDRLNEEIQVINIQLMQERAKNND